MKKILLAFGITTVLFTSCSKNEGDNNDNNDLNRKNMLNNYAENYVIPAYENMLGKLTELKAKTESFTSTPNEANLTDLQQSWREVYTIWQRTEMLEFGPAEDASLRMYMNIYPVSVTKVNSNISS